MHFAFEPAVVVEVEEVEVLYGVVLVLVQLGKEGFYECGYVLGAFDGGKALEEEHDLLLEGA